MHDDKEFRTPLRLLFLSDAAISTSGGSERFLRNLLRHLSPSMYRVTLVQLCLEPQMKYRLHDTQIASIEMQMYMPTREVYGVEGLAILRRLRRMVREQAFDVIQSQHESADVFNALLPRGPAHAVRISNRRDTGFLKSAKLRLAARLLNRRYDRIVAPSQAILDAVARTERARPRNMLCIPNGVDTERFQPVDATQRRGLRQTLGFEEDVLLVGCVGSLTEVKRHADLLEAFARTRGAQPEAHLLLVGEGPLRGAIAQRSAAADLAGHVHLLGQRPDVQHVLQALDLFVLASETEGLSNAILEAQACGLPVVATHVGGNPEVVRSDCGVLVPAGAPQALADAMLDLLRDPDKRAAMGQCAVQRTLREHSLDAMVHAYEALYRELVHAR